MTCKKDHVPFNGTPEQEKALKEVIAQLKDTKGALMPIMQHAQDIYGYLPIEVQTMAFRTSFYQLDDEVRQEVVETIRLKLQYHRDPERAEQIKQVKGW